MDYKQKMAVAVAETLKAYTDGDPDRTWNIAYSGGKDSTVTLDIILRALIQLRKYNPALLIRKLYLTTAQTHLDFVTDPLKQEELHKVRTVIERYELPVEIVEVSAEPKNSFMFLVVGKGYPLPKSKIDRWCTSRLKVDPQLKAIKQFKPIYSAVGVRLSESASRREIIERDRDSEFYTDSTFMPIVNFTLDDIWSYLVHEGMCWGNAEKLGQLYKEATGECGLRQKKAGSGEKNDDPCGARTGCIICPVVTIDKSSQEFAKHHPHLQPYVDLRNVIIAMYKNPKNKAGRRRNGAVMGYGQGTFTIKARMELYTLIKQAEADNAELCKRFDETPQKLIYSDELDHLIQQQWQEDLNECPWVEDAAEIGQFYEAKIKGIDGFQIIINFEHESFMTC